MINSQIKLFVLLFIAIALPQVGPSQDNLNNDLSYDIHISYPPLSITKEILNDAQTLADLNRQYKPSWIKEFISVEIETTYQGKIRKAASKNDILSQEQKDMMNTADAGTGISVNVQYIPDNNLTHNDTKEIDFTFTVDPDNEAKYSGGQQQLKQYLKDNIIDNISDVKFKKYQLAAVKFTIDEEGHVIDPHVLWTSEDDKVDELFLQTVCNMPSWKPAEYSDGTKIKQDFVLAVGDMESCVVNLLNIRHELE